MADRIRPKGLTAAAWAAANPVLARREFVLETDTGKMKFGDGINFYSNLPYASKGDPGPKGDQGDFSYAVDLIGTSTTSLTIEVDVHTLQASTGKSWCPGMWITVAYSVDATKCMVGQCISYNPSTGALVVNVSQAVYGSGTYATWTISYAASAGSSVSHADTHTPGGYDEIPIASESSAGLLSPADAFKLGNLEVTGIFISETEPPDMAVGQVWLCSADLVYTAPVVGAVYPQYSLLDTGFSIPISLSDAYDVSMVSLGIVGSSNTGVIPLSALSVRGSGSTRFIDVEARPTAGSSILTVTATGFGGAASSVAISVSIVAQAYTITASSSGTHGDISPVGAILVPATGSITFTPVADSGYALSSFTVDGTPIVADSYTFNNVAADHTIVANFAVGYIITATAHGNGVIIPSGAVGVVSNSSKTFNFAGNAGYEPYQKFIDGGPAQDASSGTHTFTGVTTNHTISVNFTAQYFDVTWSGLSNGTINATASGSLSVAYNQPCQFSISPNANYETIGITVDGVAVTVTEDYTIPAVTSDTVIGATFRILPPSAVAPPNVAPGNQTLTVTWEVSTPVPATAYDIYYLANSTNAVTIKATGTKITGATSGAQISGLSNTTTYGVIVVARNANPAETSSAVVSGSPTSNLFPSSSISAPLQNLPRITGITPAPGTTGVAVDTTITVTFSEAMTWTTAAANFKVYSDASRTTEKAGTLSQVSSTVWSYGPTTNYAGAATYYPCLKTGAQATTGVPLGSQENWEFFTV